MFDLSGYGEIIIWGASFPPEETGENSTNTGRAIEYLRDLLNRENAWEKVLFVVDSNKELQGKERLGKVVKDPLEILQHSKALIIINTISIAAIQKALKDMNAKNDCAIIPYYFYHGTADHLYINEVAQKDAEAHEGQIRELYSKDDDVTKRYLDKILSVRKKGIDELYTVQDYAGLESGVAYFSDSELAPKGDVTFIDVGAYIGDSIEPVCKFYGKRFKKCYAFEPGDDARSRLLKYLADNDMEDVTVVYPYALGDVDQQIRFSSAGMAGEVSTTGSVILEQRVFDNLPNIDIVGDAMIKMDIEGAEMGALKGMESFIKEQEPYLAICVYHKEKDLYEIAAYIKKLVPSYRLYIRGGWHLECWAVPERHFVTQKQ